MPLQVVVVVTSQWDVLCFDHNLRLMWSGKDQGEASLLAYCNVY